MTTLTITALTGIPRVKPGDDLARLLIAALDSNGLRPQRRDILVVAQKIVSKSEGAFAELAQQVPTAKAREVAGVVGKDPHLMQAVLSQSRDVVRMKKNILIVETHHGFVMANAGVDQSNLEPQDQNARVLLLPTDPDASAAALKAKMDAHYGVEIGVVISDSVGRAWRLGTVGLAIGAAGVPSLWDRRGEADMSGRTLEVTEVAFADAVAASAVLVMGEGAEGKPAALVRGLDWSAPERPAKSLLRPRHEDMFR
jgi:coenzyme F420-0:L-glutamate ligase / coenzyme F420-1:gamma-L-glutamate ligase